MEEMKTVFKKIYKNNVSFKLNLKLGCRLEASGGVAVVSNI